MKNLLREITKGVYSPVKERSGLGEELSACLLFPIIMLAVLAVACLISLI